MQFIISAPSFDEKSGGVIALYLLCQRLNILGYKASIWHNLRPPVKYPTIFKDFKSLISYYIMKRSPFSTGVFDVNVARYSDIKHSIVVYPEIISGNPLNSKYVVRWLLNKPGFFTGNIDYQPSDLVFYYMKSFDDPSINPYSDNELCLTWNHPAYVNSNIGDRSGTCHMFRKGRNRCLNAPAGSVEIDDLSHENTAAAFNRSERFVCFDLYTRYVIYAAICGCIPIIVPEPGLSIEQWMPNVEDRYGIAYGEENIPWALETRGLLHERLARQGAREDALLLNFINRCRLYFKQ